MMKYPILWIVGPNGRRMVIFCASKIIGVFIEYVLQYIHVPFHLFQQSSCKAYAHSQSNSGIIA
jgi:hypothetical protein